MCQCSVLSEEQDYEMKKTARTKQYTIVYYFSSLDTWHDFICIETQWESMLWGYEEYPLVNQGHTMQNVIGCLLRTTSQRRSLLKPSPLAPLFPPVQFLLVMSWEDERKQWVLRSALPFLSFCYTPSCLTLMPQPCTHISVNTETFRDVLVYGSLSVPCWGKEVTFHTLWP